MVQPISRRAYARRAGISATAVRKLIASGVLAGAVLPSGLLDPDEADRLRAENTTRGASAAVPIQDAQLRLLRARVRRLQTEVEEQERHQGRPEDFQTIAQGQYDIITDRIRQLPSAARAAAGLPQKEALSLLRDDLHRALEDISSDDGEKQTEEEGVRVDIDALTPAALASLQRNLQATLLELAHALSTGEHMLGLGMIESFEERLTVCKSIIVNIPPQVAPLAIALSADEVHELVQSEVERAVEVLTRAA